MRKRLSLVLLAASLLLAACDQVIYSGLTPKDANEIVALLYRNNIDATRISGENNGFSVSVSTGDFARAIEILNRYGYPKEQHRTLAEVFPGDGLIISPLEQHARLTYAMSQELEKTISAIDGVVSTRVHVVLPEMDLRTGNLSRASAAVMVVHRPSIDTLELSQKIRLMVANAIPDLNIRDVSIAFFSSDGTVNGAVAADKTPSGASALDVGKFLAASPSTTILLWVFSGAAVLFSLVIFLRRMLSRT